jgi:lysophospholipase L1-like esterase
VIQVRLLPAIVIIILIWGSYPSLIAADGLHFSGKEYTRWAGLMEPCLKEMLQ